ncbi:MAG: orotidine-5'-phosphate decarboxylase, partial [Actinobacteria bacterium]|nr:orotidine-5'-phosphate decarboxylase [Actinomycetota bacterium]
GVGKIKLADRLIISIDVSSKQDLISLCAKVNNSVSTLKLGLELIYSCGLDSVNIVKSFGYNVMLDAKLLDIPNTVSRAVSAITHLGVDKITIHTLGGYRMLKEARERIISVSSKLNILPPSLFGVTILTSLDNNDLRDIGFNKNFDDSVLNLAELAIKSGLDGIICSPNEVKKIRKTFGQDFFIATPGIRIGSDDAFDQKRFNAPGLAIKDGADFIIVGRSVTSKENIPETIESIKVEVKEVLCETKSN